MSLIRRFSVGTGVVLLALSSACGDDNGSPTIQPIVGVTATALGSTTVKVSFTSRTSDNSYTIERAEGTGAFAQVGTIPAPTTAGAVSFTDSVGLKPATAYQYHVIAVAGSLSSTASNAASVTTLALGAAAADITLDITASRTLFRDTTYTLKGFIHVANGATLTIQSGTTIKGDFNTLGSSLFILRGAKINAVGTVDQPIVFTSSQAAGARKPGDWGGLILVGNGLSNRSGNVIIEGSGTVAGTTSGTNYAVTYSGGTSATDNSGVLSYVRVEFAGYAPLQDNELNAFTFAAVGSGTRVSYLEALAGLDDSYEFFGGALDGDHLVAYETADDMYDMSEGFSGRLQYLIGFNSQQLTPRTGAGNLSVDLEGIENDGCNGTGCDNGFNQAPFTIPVIANFTLIGCGSANCVGASGGYGMMLRRGTGGYYINGVMTRFPTAGVSLRDAETYLRAGSVVTPDLTTADLAIRNVYFSDLGASVPMFQPTSATQFAFDPAGNSLTLATTLSTALFTAIPATGTAPTGVAQLDFTPVTGSAIATGGLATFTGKLATKAGTFVTGTAYLGAVAPGATGTAKWWTGWTSYARN